MAWWVSLMILRACSLVGVRTNHYKWTICMRCREISKQLLPKEEPLQCQWALKVEFNPHLISLNRHLSFLNSKFYNMLMLHKALHLHHHKWVLVKINMMFIHLVNHLLILLWHNWRQWCRIKKMKIKSSEKSLKTLPRTQVHMTTSSNNFEAKIKT